MLKRGAGIFLSLIILTLLLLPTAFPQMTPEDRIFIQQENQKLEAKISSKIDTQANRMEETIDSRIESAKSDIKSGIQQEVSSSLKSIAIGLAGMIIVSLAIFKIIDVRITYNTNIKKYENKLKKQSEELDILIKKNKEYQAELNKYRESLIKKSKQLNLPTPVKGDMKLPKPQKKKLFNFNLNRKFVKVMVLIVGLIIIIGWLVYTFIGVNFVR